MHQEWLSKEDIQYFEEGTGLLRMNIVDHACYDEQYFSSEHFADTDGYDLEGRLNKYSDAIENIKNLLIHFTLVACLGLRCLRCNVSIGRSLAQNPNALQSCRPRASVLVNNGSPRMLG